MVNSIKHTDATTRASERVTMDEGGKGGLRDLYNGQIESLAICPWPPHLKQLTTGFRSAEAGDKAISRVYEDDDDDDETAESLEVDDLWERQSAVMWVEELGW